MKQRDNLHFNFRTIDGYDKPINIVISAREAAKTTGVILDKAYASWKRDESTTLFLVRQNVEISDALILDIQNNNINKFTDDNVIFEYSRGSMRDGICDLFIPKEDKRMVKHTITDDDGKEHEEEYEEVYTRKSLFMRILALQIPARRIKQAKIGNIAYIIFDEFIVNQREGEKYLKHESTKIAEVYTTYKREKTDNVKLVKMYFLGNPYSLYNPVFMWLGINGNKLKFGECYAGGEYVVQWYRLSDELKAKILSENPLYRFDETYRDYALNGKPVLDKNIRIKESIPVNYNLRFIFKIDGKYIGIYKNKYYDYGFDGYYCKFLDQMEISKRRDIYCFDFGELVEHTALISKDELNKFNKFKIAMRNRLVEFESVDCYYLTEEIYYNL